MRIYKWTYFLLLFQYIDVVFGKSSVQQCHPPILPSENIEIECSTPDVTKTVNNCSTSQPIGTLLKFRCKNGFIPASSFQFNVSFVQLSGFLPDGQRRTRTLTCIYDGSWFGYESLVDFHCIAPKFATTEETTESTTPSTIQCQPLITFLTQRTEFLCLRENGMTNNCSDLQPVGTKAEILCKDFYVPRNSDSEINLKCNDKGIWSGIDRLEEFECRPVCGRRIVDAKPLIVNGKYTNSTSWPWHAAIFRIPDIPEDAKPIYICGGSLISEKVIITAAHCVTDNRGVLLPTELLTISLGTINSNISLNMGPDVQIFGVAHILIHRSYDARTLNSDIAIVELDKGAQFSDYILPICIPDGYAMDTFALAPGNRGDVVGFGKDENNKPSSSLRHIKIPVASFEDCYKNLNQVLLDSQVCAGNRRTGEYVCRGDSGNGLVFPNEISSAYYLHGIVSTGDPNARRESVCQNYGVFTRVYNFINWIEEQLEEITGQKQSLTSNYSNYTFTIQGTEDVNIRFTGVPKHVKFSGIHLQYVDFEPEILIRSIENSRGVESIKLDSVELLSTVWRRIRLPHLKEFRLDAGERDVQHSENYDSLDENYIKSLLFFDVDEEWELKTILHLNVNVELKQSRWIVLKIDHESGEFVSQTESTTHILRNVPEQFNLTKLSVRKEVFYASSVPSQVTYLNLRLVALLDHRDGTNEGLPGHGSNRSQADTQLALLKFRQEAGSRGFPDIFERCTQLETFIHEPLIPTPADISTLLMNAKKLKRLAFVKTPILVSNLKTTSATSVENLVLSSIEINTELQANIHRIFPNIKEIILRCHDIPWDYSALIKNLFDEIPSLNSIVILNFKHPRYSEIIRDDGIQVKLSEFGVRVENMLEELGIRAEPGVFNYIFEKNGSTMTWSLKNQLSHLQAELLVSRATDSDKFFTSHEDFVAESRLGPQERQLFEFPEKYTLSGTGVNNLVKFHGIPTKLQPDLRHIQINYADVPLDAFVTSLSKTMQLESLILNNVKLDGSLAHRIFAPNLKWYGFDRIHTSKFIYQFKEDESSLVSLIPFTSRSAQLWQSDQVLSLGFNIDLRIKGVRIFAVNHDTGAVFSSLWNSEQILLTHYQNGPKNDSLVIKELRLEDCTLKSSSMEMETLEKLYLFNVRLPGSGSQLKRIIQKSQNLQQLSLVGVFANSFIGLQVDLQDIPSAHLKTLRMYEFNSVHINDTDVPAPVFWNLDKLILAKYETMGENVVENFFTIFHANKYYLSLNVEEYPILEKVTTMEEISWADEIQLVIPLNFGEDGPPYSNTLISFLKELDVLKNGSDYYVNLQRWKNRTWTGESDYSTKGHKMWNPIDLFPSFDVL